MANKENGEIYKGGRRQGGCMRALITKDFWYEKRTEVLEKGTEVEVERNGDDWFVIFDDGQVYIDSEYFEKIS
jgi:hypothetical protein